MFSSSMPSVHTQNYISSFDETQALFNRYTNNPFGVVHRQSYDIRQQIKHVQRNLIASAIDLLSVNCQKAHSSTPRMQSAAVMRSHNSSDCSVGAMKTFARTYTV
jgi:hypothetical protein